MEKNVANSYRIDTRGADVTCENMRACARVIDVPAAGTIVRAVRGTVM